MVLREGPAGWLVAGWPSECKPLENGLEGGETLGDGVKELWGGSERALREGVKELLQIGERGMGKGEE
ncbi:hypothetical protein Pmani_016083 [Petrolisthes manimaculis]|uniref:Uncharacterized protein n=1 Tax=Petrolisthes manimaculis TaxID=1843537 RepID=A0AAE1PQZ0_9EUCA|nr:hypothetical protein Pmani_016083 [Petrolisthes manimaculis]